MNDPMILAAAVVLVIAAVGAAAVQVINAKAAADDRKEAKIARIELRAIADTTVAKTDKIIEQGVAIHTLTNSNLSKVTADLATALSKIGSLEKMITSMDKAKDIADVLATSKAEKIVEDPKTLESIKKNTGDTVKAVKKLGEE